MGLRTDSGDRAELAATTRIWPSDIAPRRQGGDVAPSLSAVGPGVPALALAAGGGLPSGQEQLTEVLHGAGGGSERRTGGVVHVVRASRLRYQATCTCEWSTPPRFVRGFAVVDGLAHARATGCRPGSPLVLRGASTRGLRLAGPA